MTDDRSLERAARSWLEIGPTQAPDRAVEAALHRIQSTPQERDLRIPWRLPTMNPLARVAVLVVLVALAAAGAIYVIGSPSGPPAPSPTVTPPSIEGTWDVTFTREEMLAAGIADSAEDSIENYGHFTLSIHAGIVETAHLAPTTCCASTGTYVIDGNTYTATTGGETFSWPFTVTDTTLTFGPGGPVTLRVKPWTRVGP